MEVVLGKSKRLMMITGLITPPTLGERTEGELLIPKSSGWHANPPRD